MLESYTKQQNDAKSSIEVVFHYSHNVILATTTVTLEFQDSCCHAQSAQSADEMSCTQL